MNWRDIPSTLSAHGADRFEDVKFEKTGAEIQRSIDAKLSGLAAAISKSEAVISEICKRREVEPTEVLGVDAQETAQKVETYSTSNAERYQAKTAFEKFHADMQAIRTEAYGIEGARNEMDGLARVKRNIQSERKFDLGYRELQRLGF